MPELPEVESIRRSLAPLLVGRSVLQVSVRRRDVVTRPMDPPGGASRSRGAARSKTVPRREMLVGGRIAELRRHGKQLLVLGDSGRGLLMHFGMTGQALVRARRARSAPHDAHTHIVWMLEDGRELVFRDARRFGGVWTVESEQDAWDRFWGRLGPDALSISAAALGSGLSETTRAVKAALLDQAVLAGVGNIYADEGLFAAGVHPARRGDKLRDDEVERLASAIRDVLAAAVEAKGSTLRDYRLADESSGGFQMRHTVYGRAGLACVRCGGVLGRTVIGQRTTVFCAVCQPRRPGRSGSSSSQ